MPIDRVSNPAPSAFNRGWPLPALAVWSLAWWVDAALRPTMAAPSSLVLATGLGLVLAMRMDRPWRRLVTAAGFPALALASAVTAALPAWIWLLPLALLLALYPRRAWRDAPLFPTPPNALDGLAERLPLPAGARLLDAGCGVGDGLLALHSAWPTARVEGIEWSWLLAIGAELRCRSRHLVHRNDMWAWHWGCFDLVYLFQRPESMARAWDKACAEMKPGAWLVSLEFVVPGRVADIELPLAGGRSLRAWKVPADARIQSGTPPADKPA